MTKTHDIASALGPFLPEPTSAVGKDTMAGASNTLAAQDQHQNPTQNPTQYRAEDQAEPTAPFDAAPSLTSTVAPATPRQSPTPESSTTAKAAFAQTAAATRFGIAGRLLSDTDLEHDLARTEYAPHGIRKTVFAVVFLLLLPFFASLPAMIYQRVAAGVWLDTWGLLVIAVAFTALMALILFELIYALRAEIRLEDKGIHMVLPTGTPGSIPMFNYRHHDVAYDDILAIEQRSEIYGGSLAPVMMTSTWIKLKDHRRVLIGSLNSSATDHIFPFRVIGQQVADRAGVPIVDLGAVKRPVRDAVIGLMATETDGARLSDAAVADLNARHRTLMIAIISVFLFLLGLSLASDMLAGSTDLGERQPTTGLPWISG